MFEVVLRELPVGLPVGSSWPGYFSLMEAF